MTQLLSSSLAVEAIQAVVPYPGLRPFRKDEHLIFFGRRQQIDEVLDRLDEDGFVAVIGESGAGKSSLVLAGVIPSLIKGALPHEGSGWTVVTLQPGASPLLETAKALLGCKDTAEALNTVPVTSDGREAMSSQEELAIRLGTSAFALVDILQQTNRSSGKAVLLLVDQFEEIFRYVQRPDPLAPIKFVASLLQVIASAKNGVYVMITMRSDYLGDCARFPGLSEAVNQSAYLTPRLSRERQREAIEGPLRHFDAVADPFLVNALLNETVKDGKEQLDPAEEGRDKLPLLQHALLTQWNRGSDTEGKRLLVLEDFEELATTDGLSTASAAAGPLQRVLDRQGDQALAEAKALPTSTDAGLISERLFKCLTNRDQRKEDSRREVTPKQVAEIVGLVDTSEVAKVADIFRRDGRNFILPDQIEVPTLGEDTPLDLVHESLIRRWETLSKWADQERNEIIEYDRLVRDACRWADDHKSDSNTMGFSLYREYRDWPKQREARFKWVAFRHEASSSEVEDQTKRDFDLVIKYIKASGKHHWRSLWRRGLYFLGLAGLVAAMMLVPSFLRVRSQETELLQIKSRLRVAQFQASAAQDEVDLARATLDRVQQRIQTQEQELVKRQSELKKAQAFVSKARKDRDLLVSKAYALQRQVAASEAIAGRTAQALQKAESNLAQVTEQRDNAAADLIRKNQELAKVMASVTITTNELKKLTAQRDAALLENKRLSDRVDGLAQEALDASKARDVARAELATVQGQLDEANKIIQNLENTSQEILDLKEQLADAQKRANTYTSSRGKFILKLNTMPGISTIQHNNEKWDLRTGDVVSNPVFDYSDTYLVMSGASGKLFMFKLSDAGPIQQTTKDYPGIAQMRISKHEAHLAVLTENGNIDVFDLEKSDITWLGGVKSDPKSRFTVIAFADDDGDNMYLETSDGRAFRWKVSADSKPVSIDSRGQQSPAQRPSGGKGG